MKNEENKAFRTAFWLLGPLIFYELCTEASAWVCSLFGTQDALLVTGGGALLALPFLYAAYRKKLQVDVRERDAGAGQVPRTDRRWCTDQPQRTGPWLCTGQAQCARSLRTGCFFAALAGMGACLVLNVLLQLLFPLSDGWDSTREAVYGTSIALQLLVTVVLAPLTEELLFRGLIRAELRTHMKPRTAALMGALLFGMYHGNISQGMYAFFLALCLELVCEWSSSLLPAVCMHAGANAASVCFTALMSGMSDAFSMRFALAAAAAGAILTTAALYKTKEVFSKS